ncbi:MAG: cytochrome c3 family protein [Nitrospirae bacterium]|nr:cytochrome c3 family protein [Nitrospirota bacterium]
MRRLLAMLSLSAFIVLPCLYAQAESGPLGLSADGCITDKCHAGMMQRKFVHGPVAVGDCLHCHKKTGDHKFQKAAGNGTMCFICHEETPAGVSLVCVNCHDPHGTDIEFQLKAGAGSICKK